MDICKELLLTFVLPCYNVEKLVQRCIDSIYECDLNENEFEVLCINDCSPDGTQKILELNQNRHENLRVVIHEVNKKLGGARNTGIREAHGKYLWFVDTDDTIKCGQLKRALAKATEERLDVLCFNYQRIDSQGNVLETHRVFDEYAPQDGLSFSDNAFGHNGIVYHMGFVWRFLYRTEFLRKHGLFFPEYVCWEDTVFMPKTILCSERIAAIPEIMYSYRVNPNSICETFSRSYPAKLIYEYAFCAGLDLLRFSDEVPSEDLRESFRKISINKYLNGFSIHLFRTSGKERQDFYRLIRENKKVIQGVRKHMSVFNNVLLIPFIGPLLAFLVSVVYKWTH